MRDILIFIGIGIVVLVVDVLIYVFVSKTSYERGYSDGRQVKIRCEKRRIRINGFKRAREEYMKHFNKRKEEADASDSEKEPITDISE